MAVAKLLLCCDIIIMQMLYRGVALFTFTRVMAAILESNAWVQEDDFNWGGGGGGAFILLIMMLK